VDARLDALLAAAARWLGRCRLLPIRDPLKASPVLDHVYQRGYEIVFRPCRPSKRYQKWIFLARRNRQVVGRLDVDFIQVGRRLYVENIHVLESHGKRGIGAALIVSAVQTTACELLTTSCRTAQGARFFDRMRPILHAHGVEMRDPPSRPRLAAVAQCGNLL
jgi:hypothetical protein